jgi:hypothetical protein
VVQGASQLPAQSQQQRASQEHNKALPNIGVQPQASGDSQSSSLKIQGSQQQQPQQQSQVKPNNVPQMATQQQQMGGGVGAGLAGSLPPIGGNSIGGASVASSQLQQGSVGSQQSKYFTDASNRVNGLRTNPVVPLHKKKKKVRIRAINLHANSCLYI